MVTFRLGRWGIHALPDGHRILMPALTWLWRWTHKREQGNCNLSNRAYRRWWKQLQWVLFSLVRIKTKGLSEKESIGFYNCSFLQNWSKTKPKNCSAGSSSVTCNDFNDWKINLKIQGMWNSRYSAHSHRPTYGSFCFDHDIHCQSHTLLCTSQI